MFQKKKLDLLEIGRELQNLNILQFGEFTLRSGIKSSFYLDLRLLPSYPELFKKLINSIQINIDVKLFGIAYNGIPITTALSLATNKPLIYNRKEAKGYGLKKMLEGVFKDGDEVIIVDDVLTSGTSFKEAINIAHEHNLKPIGFIVLIDRRLVPTDYIFDLPIYSVISLQDMFLEMRIGGILNVNPYKMTYLERREVLKSSKAKGILDLINEKQSNLILSADALSFDQICNLIQIVGSQICALKLHLDCINHYNFDILLNLSIGHRFFIIEDRKFADIGNTVVAQMNALPKSIHSVTAHSIFGQGTIDGIVKVNKDIGIFLLAQASSADNIIDDTYTQKTIELAKKNVNVIGFISQQQIAGPEYLYLTPGVNITESGDNLGQSYTDPETIIKGGTDLLIVGRGITCAKNPLEMAQKYRDIGFRNYFRVDEKN
jgi:uridine monophosphate synthetase